MWEQFNKLNYKKKVEKIHELQYLILRTVLENREQFLKIENSFDQCINLRKIIFLLYQR